MPKLAWSLDLKEKEILTLMLCVLSKEWYRSNSFLGYQELHGKVGAQHRVEAGGITDAWGPQLHTQTLSFVAGVCTHCQGV